MPRVPAGCRPKPPPGQWNVGFLHHIHSGEQFGPVGVVISLLSGLALVFFAFSGLWMYIRMWRDRSAIVTKNAEDIRNIQRAGYENQQRSQDRISEMRSQTMRGVETYRDPTSGETVELSNQYGHAWVNNRGEYLLSDQEGFDPSVTFKEDWKPLEHVKP